MSRALLRFAVLAALALVAGGMHAGATTVNLITDADTSIFSPFPDNDFGTSMLVAGANGVGARGRGLLHFDLSSIPAGAEITFAVITMTVVKIPPGDQHAGPADSAYGLYRMLVPWQEGTGGGPMGAPAQVGDPTWIERGAFGLASWGTPGGQDGTDYVSNPSTNASVGLDYGNVVWGATFELLADLQMWLDQPDTNFGYMMISDQESNPGTARRIASRETADNGALPPTLTVTYSFVPEPGVGLLMAIGALVGVQRRRSGKLRK